MEMFNHSVSLAIPLQLHRHAIRLGMATTTCSVCLQESIPFIHQSSTVSPDAFDVWQRDLYSALLYLNHNVL